MCVTGSIRQLSFDYEYAAIRVPYKDGSTVSSPPVLLLKVLFLTMVSGRLATHKHGRFHSNNIK